MKKYIIINKLNNTGSISILYHLSIIIYRLINFDLIDYSYNRNKN